MKEPGLLIRGEEFATSTLLERVRAKKRRVVVFAEPGSDELRYLDAMSANANVGGELLTHIVVRPDVRTIEVWEEFLHGTQKKCGVLEGRSNQEAEVHVKKFMIRHFRLLRISEGDVGVLRAYLGEPLEWKRCKAFT